MRVGTVSFGGKPKASEPDPTGYEMALAAIAHAQSHLNFVMEHTSQLFIRNDSANKRMDVIRRNPVPMPADQPLALEMEIKNCVEDLMSALEYLAMEIYETVCCDDTQHEKPHVHKSVNFPIPLLDSTAEDFSARIEEKLPQLRARRPDVFEVILDCRHFSSGSMVWLDTISTTWPEVKHRRLSRTTTKAMKVHFGTPDGLAEGPEVDVQYFPGTTRGIVANLSAAILCIGALVKHVSTLLPPPSEVHQVQTGNADPS